ncbi:FAD-dependent oxidoreductase [Streptomyces sp. NPDC001709]
MSGWRQGTPFVWLEAAQSDPDVVVVGAGIAGCAAALAFARRGARVVVLDSTSAPSARLAGEWLHPAGGAVLRRLGITDLAGHGVSGTGFTVYPADGSESIALPYPDGVTGLSIPHHTLLGRLQQAVQDRPEVEFVRGVHARVTGQGRVETNGRGRGRTHRFRADVVVGADGRSSQVREFLGAADRHITPSRTAGVLLEDEELGEPGFGRVLLGGPGPVLAYHIAPSRIRLCFDVPLTHPRPPAPYDYLWHGYHRAVSEELRRP